MGGTRDARLQGYQVSSVLCPRGVTVMDAQKRLNFKSGRPAACIEICMFSRARAQDAAAATRFKPQPFFGYCCKTGELNTTICSGSSKEMLCSRYQALERCKSKYSVVCSSLNTAVWPAGRRFVTLARNLAGWRRGVWWRHVRVFAHIVPELNYVPSRVGG